MILGIVLIILAIVVLIIIGRSLELGHNEECPRCGSQHTEEVCCVGYLTWKYRCKKCGKEFTVQCAPHD